MDNIDERLNNQNKGIVYLIKTLELKELQYPKMYEQAQREIEQIKRQMELQCMIPIKKIKNTHK